jgi:hypothetical protein
VSSPKQAVKKAQSKRLGINLAVLGKLNVMTTKASKVIQSSKTERQKMNMEFTYKNVFLKKCLFKKISLFIAGEEIIIVCNCFINTILERPTSSYSKSFLESRSAVSLSFLRN